MLAPVLQVTVIITSLAGPVFGNSVIEFDQESGMFPGRGYDTVAGVVKGDCVTRSDTEVPGNSKAVRTQFSISKAESYSSLARATGISASASFAGGMFSASGKASFLESISVNDYSLYVLAQVQVDNATQVMLDPELITSAFELMRDGTPEAFHQRCGNAFISGYTTGGELYSIIEIKTKSNEEKREISAEIGGSYGAFSAAGKFTEAIRKISEKSNVNVFVYRTGAASVVQVTPEAMIQEAVNFPIGLADENAFIYKATITPYSNIPLPPGKLPSDIVNAEEVTAKLSEYRLQAYQDLANLEYVLRNPVEFVDPDVVKISNSAMAVRRDVNEIVKAARICARSLEKCVFPSELKPTVISLPLRVDASTETAAQREAESERLRLELEARLADAEAVQHENEIALLEAERLAEDAYQKRLKAEEDKEKAEAALIQAEIDKAEADRLRAEAEEERRVAERKREEALIGAAVGATTTIMGGGGDPISGLLRGIFK